MTIYVDTPKRYNTPLRHKIWAHMVCDSNDQAELHAMADRIGLRREWFQNHATMPHYDVTPSKRALAIAHGAIAVDTRTLVLKCSKLFRHRSAE